MEIWTSLIYWCKYKALEHLSRCIRTNWKAGGKNIPHSCRFLGHFWKCPKITWILACGLRFTRETLLWRFLHWLALHFQEILYAKKALSLAASFCFCKCIYCITCHNNSRLIFLSFSFMARKLYALALEKCAPESADNPMMQEVLLGGHLYLMCLKVAESSISMPIFLYSPIHVTLKYMENESALSCERLAVGDLVIYNTP